MIDGLAEQRMPGAAAASECGACRIELANAVQQIAHFHATVCTSEDPFPCKNCIRAHANVSACASKEADRKANRKTSLKWVVTPRVFVKSLRPFQSTRSYCARQLIKSEVKKLLEIYEVALSLDDTRDSFISACTTTDQNTVVKPV
jgi:hypothetical protein